nr:nodulin homeobox [Ipomoea batatas]
MVEHSTVDAIAIRLAVAATVCRPAWFDSKLKDLLCGWSTGNCPPEVSSVDYGFSSPITHPPGSRPPLRAEESPRRSAPLLHDSSPLRPSTIPSSKSRSALAKSIALKTEVLTAIFSPAHGEFLSSWCSPDLPVREEDATLEYDPFAAAGWLFNFYSSYQLIGASSESTFNPSNVPRVPYGHQRTSLLAHQRRGEPPPVSESEHDLKLYEEGGRRPHPGKEVSNLDPSPNTDPSTSLSLCSKLVVVVFAEAEVAAITVAEPVATAAERNRRRSRELFAVTFAAVSRVAVAPPSPSQQVTPDTITFAATVSSFHPRDLRTNNTDSKEIHHRGRRQFRDLLTL